MSTYRLGRLFAPRSVALVGGSHRTKSVGRTILSNLKAAEFEGPIHLVNLQYSEIDGTRTVKNVADIPEPADVCVIAAPPAEVPGH